MIDLPTPETDAVAEKNIYGVACKVDVDFARKLERERDEAREKYSTEATEYMLSVNKLCGERDDARNKLADALQEIDLRTLDFERMKQERDEARESLENARELNKWLTVFLEHIRDNADIRYGKHRGLLAFSDLREEASRKGEITEARKMETSSRQ